MDIIFCSWYMFLTKMFIKFISVEKILLSKKKILLFLHLKVGDRLPFRET